jgi:hypothetical protein
VHAVRVVAVAHQAADLGAKRLVVEGQRLLAASVEEQVGLDLHGAGSSFVNFMVNR